MTASNHRRRLQPSEESPSEPSRSSFLGAILMIAGVLVAAAIVSILFVRMPTTSDVNRQRLQAAGAEATSNERLSTDVPDESIALPPAKVDWIAELPYGTHGSPSLFRDDEHAEMIIAYGDERKRVGGAMAIDAATGQSRWEITSQDEMFTLPMPLPIREGGEAPWIVAGRNGQLYAVDARSGEQLWKFEPSGEEGRSEGIYNFFTGRVLEDVDGDGVDDYLIPNGGDSRRNRFQARPPGHLLVVSGATGAEIHRLPIPDQHETYLSPLLWQRGNETLVVFGSGGETFPGSLWTVPLASVRSGSLEGVRVVVPNTESKGAIPPPSFADLDQDGVLDLIATPFDGRLVVVSGRTLATLWQFTPTGVHETQCSPTIADFDGDGDLDVAYVTQHGVFPRWTASDVRVFDGNTGDLMWEHRIDGNLSAASPFALDIDGDQRDELFFIHANPALFRAADSGKSVSQLQMVHVEEGRIEELGAVDGFNAGSGWIGDADEDGQLEWIIPLKMDDRSGRLVKVDLQVAAPEFIAWGGYLGTQHDGVYHDRQASKEQL